MKVDHGSYFHNYIQKKHTNRKLRKEERKIKRKRERYKGTNRQRMRKE